jgi:hypothetical protein
MNSNSESDKSETEGNFAQRTEGEPRNPRLLVANWIYSGRQDRPGVDDTRLFGEPAWDMILDLYIHQAKGRPTSITAACIGSHAPATTALRYIDLLCELGWVEKIPDDNDRRRSLLALTPSAKERMSGYLDRMLEGLARMAPELLSLPRTDPPYMPEENT